MFLEKVGRLLVCLPIRNRLNNYEVMRLCRTGGYKLQYRNASTTHNSMGSYSSSRKSENFKNL
jgi:hypothetical protein